jgi:hypothetical protein
MESLSSASNDRNGSKDDAKAEDAILLAAAALVPHYNGNLVAAHNAASNLKAIGDAKKSLIAYARHKIRFEHILANPSKGMCSIVGDKNPTRAKPKFLKRLKFVQGDADEFTVRNTVNVFEVSVDIYRGRKEWMEEGFSDVDLMVLQNILGDSKFSVLTRF